MLEGTGDRLLPRSRIVQKRAHAGVAIEVNTRREDWLLRPDYCLIAFDAFDARMRNSVFLEVSQNLEHS